jgi:hypothetical protein
MGGKRHDPNKAARQALKAQMARLDKIDLPELEEYILQNPELVGLLEAEQLDPSSMEEISTDPALKEKQMQALMGLQERSEQGLTAQDKMQMEEMLGQVGAQEKSQRASIEAEMQRRGTADSGASLMAKLQGSQGGAQSARQKAMQMAAQGQNQRMAALQGMGQMAGQMEGADFGRQSQIASARDRIAQANAMNRQQVSAANLAARQNIENQRAGIANQQAQVANQIAQQNYNNALSKVGGQGSVAGQMASMPGAAPSPSGFQQLATIGGGIAGFMGGGGMTGASAGAQAGSMIGGAFNFEDGGIAHSKEMKAHEKFKSDYMKRVREELAPQKQARKEVTGLEDGGVARYQDGGISFQDKFKKMRAALGPGASFMWNGKEYSTDLAEESQPQTLAHEQKSLASLIPEKSEMAVGVPKQEMSTTGVPEGMNFFDINKGKDTANLSLKAAKGDQQAIQKLKDDNVEIAGQTNDKINEQDPTPVPQKDGPSFGVDDMKAVGKIAGLLGGEKEAPEKIDMPAFKMDMPENVMTPAQAQQFGNPMAQQKFGGFLEDGGLPRYEQGGLYKGTKCAEDGELMFDSTGDGAVVGGDSFERDRVDARLNSGEAVLNVAQQQRLMDLLRGEADIEDLGDEDIIEGVPMDYQQQLTDEIDNGKDKKMEGLKKLLSALGE